MNPDKVSKAKEALAKEDVSKFPSVFQQARNLAKQAWISGVGAAQGKAFLATAEKAFARLEICAGCEFFKDKRCLKCGCFMAQKAHLELASCPAGKWGAALLPDPSETTQGQPTCDHRDKPFDLAQFPEQARKEMLEIAAGVVNRGGRFTHNGIDFVATRAATGEIQINRPAPQRKLMDGWTPDDRAAFNALVEQAKATGVTETTVDFKGRQIRVRFNSNLKEANA